MVLILTSSYSKSIPVYNINSTSNENGQISEVVDMMLWYKNHSEQTLLMVSNLGKQNLILGFTWLKSHNPEVNWKKGEIVLIYCLICCSACQDIQKTDK